MKNILIVEDDITLSNGIKLALKSDKIIIDQCFDIISTKNKLKYKDFDYDLLILDINLPDGNGIELLHYIRKNSTISVIMLTANDMETDIVLGLESGANDYITKPFSLAVLRARVNTQLRLEYKNTSIRTTIDDFIFDFDKMTYFKNNTPIELSKTEQKLLKILVKNKGFTISRGDLVDKIWTDGSEYVNENALSVTIKRLRAKLDDNPAQPKYIKNIYGIGYTWAVKRYE